MKLRIVIEYKLWHFDWNNGVIAKDTMNCAPLYWGGDLTYDRKR